MGDANPCLLENRSASSPHQADGSSDNAAHQRLPLSIVPQGSTGSENLPPRPSRRRTCPSPSPGGLGGYSPSSWLFLQAPASRRGFASPPLQR